MSQPHSVNSSVPIVGKQIRHIKIGLFIVAAFLYWISLYLYVPTLPTYIETKTESLALVGTVLSMYDLWQAVIRFLLGITVDWLGRRKSFIIVGLALASFGAWLRGVADNPTGLLVGRPLRG